MPSRRRVAVERLGLSPQTVERQHQLRLQALAQRVGVREALELGQKVEISLELELRLEPLLERDQAQLLEALGLNARERLVGELAVRRSPPEAERTPKEGDRQHRVAGARDLSPLCQQTLEAGGIEHAVRELDRVARTVRADVNGVRERLAELRYVDV